MIFLIYNYLSRVPLLPGNDLLGNKNDNDIKLIKTEAA